MNRPELIKWIKKEITATKVIKCQDVVDYEETLEPNPEMYCSEFTDYPTTRDRQHIIVQKPIYGTVARTILDEKRVSEAAQALVSLILEEERYIYLAKKLMTGNDLFFQFWELLYFKSKNKKTKRIAAHRIGKAPFQLFMNRIIEVLSIFSPFLEFVWRCFVGVCTFGLIIYFFWPESKLSFWIVRSVKAIFSAFKKIISG